MRDRAEAYRDHQQALRGIVTDLRDLDPRLGQWAEGVEPYPDEILPGQLRAGADCVRVDLLTDAIETLSVLAGLTEADAIRRRRAAAQLTRSLALGR